MFERYTEQARRLVFFARYEASQLGSSSIDTEHLLLGLLREGGAVATPILRRAGVTAAAVRDEVGRRTIQREDVPTSVDIPLAATAQRVLQHAHEEAESLRSDNIGTEHILLGLLREADAVAGQILYAAGLRPHSVRQEIHAPKGAPGPRPPLFDELVGFLQDLDDRRVSYRVAAVKAGGLRVELGSPGEMSKVTFFADGRIQVDEFQLANSDVSEGCLSRLLSRLGPKPKD
jgi:ATP-dependent Clp protease ATP-binding subunit ClpC